MAGHSLISFWRQVDCNLVAIVIYYTSVLIFFSSDHAIAQGALSGQVRHVEEISEPVWVSLGGGSALPPLLLSADGITANSRW